MLTEEYVRDQGMGGAQLDCTGSWRGKATRDSDVHLEQPVDAVPHGSARVETLGWQNKRPPSAASARTAARWFIRDGRHKA